MNEPVYYLAIRFEHFMRLNRMKKACGRSVTEMVNEAVEHYLNEFYPLVCRKLPVLNEAQQRLLDEQCWQEAQDKFELNGQPVNQIYRLMESIPDYWFKGPQLKLATDAGISKSCLCRILNGVVKDPSYSIVLNIVEAFERKLERRMDPREVLDPRKKCVTPDDLNLSRPDISGRIFVVLASLPFRNPTCLPLPFCYPRPSNAL